MAERISRRQFLAAGASVAVAGPVVWARRSAAAEARELTVGGYIDLADPINTQRAAWTERWNREMAG